MVGKKILVKWNFFCIFASFTYKDKMPISIKTIKTQYGVVGNDESLDIALKNALRVAPTYLSVLITGESGVGKEVFPKIIHDFSLNKKSPYLAINCGAIPEGTINSELFGHEKGAFTGADTAHAGYFEQADGGTLFLDEVGELPMDTQARLLRVLESGEFMRMGSNEVRKTNVRIVAATNVNVEDNINKGKFRLDLYFRLKGVEIQLPALRDRKDDIMVLFREFASEYSIKNKVKAISLDEEAEKVFVNYRWPGNIRQLKNVVEQMSVLEDDRVVTAQRLQEHYLKSSFATTLPAVPHQETDHEAIDNLRRDMFLLVANLRHEIDELKRTVADLQGNVMPGTSQSVHSFVLGDAADSPTVEVSSKRESAMKDEEYDASEVIEEGDLNVENMEMAAIQQALKRHSGNRNAAAAELGISQRTLYRKLKKFDDK